MSIPNEPQPTMSEPSPSQAAPQQQDAQPTSNSKPPIQQKPAAKEKRPPKVYDIYLDGWYYNEVNKRINQEPELFRNYQINPFTKKTLDYVTPKITERKKYIPKDRYQDPCSPDCDPSIPPLTEDEQHLVDNYKLVKAAIDRSVNVPKLRFCEPQTELMRLGWFPQPRPPPKNLQCMYIKTCWSPTPCCYFHPKPTSELTQNEMYDERFRAVHQTAEFIRTETKLKAFDAIINPEGYRGKIITERKRPSVTKR